MNNFINSRPQSLCLMCGKCCRVVTAPVSFEKLNELAKNNDKGAIDFLSLFVPYESVDEARKVSPETVDNILNYQDKNVSVTTFYKCKYLLDNNLCSNYDNRPDLCKNFPSSCWAVVPPGCGYEGWLFANREKVKHYIRQIKESIIEMKAELKGTVEPKITKKLYLAIEKSENIVKFYSEFGSEDW